MSVRKAKIVTVTSVKGGVGKTTTSINLAGILSAMRKQVLVIDLDLYGSAIAASLNISNEADIYTLINDLNNNRFDSLDHYIVKYNDFIDILPAPKDPRQASKINSKYINVVLSRTSLKYDVILIDTNHVIDEINLVTMDASDEILFVVTNDPIDLKNMRSMISIFKDMDKSNYKIILNESVDRLRNYFTKYDIKNIIKDNIDYTIPSEFYIKNIDRYVLNGEILVLNKKISLTHRKAINNYKMIANSILK